MGRIILAVFAVLAIIAVAVVLITPWDDGVDSLAGAQYPVDLLLVPYLFLTFLLCHETALRTQNATGFGRPVFELTCVLLC